MPVTFKKLKPRKPTLRKIVSETTPALSSEHAEQVAVIEWCRLNANRHLELAWVFAVPNGAKLPYKRGVNGVRYSPQAIKLLAEGMLPGVCDLIIPAVRGGYAGMYLELKYGKNKVSGVQQDFMDAMTRFGYYATAAWGADSAIELINKYMEGETISGNKIREI